MLGGRPIGTACTVEMVSFDKFFPDRVELEDRNLEIYKYPLKIVLDGKDKPVIVVREGNVEKICFDRYIKYRIAIEDRGRYILVKIPEGV